MHPNSQKQPIPRDPATPKTKDIYQKYNMFSTRIKHAGIVIRHLQGRTCFFSAGSRNGVEGLDSVCLGTQKQVEPEKKIRFVTSIEKYVEGVKQNEKHVPDLLEVIIRPPGLVKEELQPILLKMVFVQNGPNYIKEQIIQGFNFLDSGISMFSRRRPMQPSGFETLQPRINPKMRVSSAVSRFLLKSVSTDRHR